MANQLANNLSTQDKDAMENMDVEKMISHVTQNVFKIMNNSDSSSGPPDISSLMSSLTGGISKKETTEQVSEIISVKTRDIFFDLNVNLEDFYTGKKKKLNVKRKRIIEENGKQRVVEEKKKIIIPIESGMKDEQQIRFVGEADQIPGYLPGDIIITLIENEHPVFQRDGDNLIINKNINFYENYDLAFDIKHLDSRILRITKPNNESLHTNDWLRKITGEGMPIFKSGKKQFGDLFIRFNLLIPKTIEQNKLTVLKKIFENNNILSDTFYKQYLLENVSENDLEELITDDDYTSESGESLNSESGSEDSSVSSVSSSESGFISKRFPKRR